MRPTRSPQPPAPATEQPAKPQGPTTTPVYASKQLFQHGRLVWIEHGSERYALRITKQGGLILTK